MMPDGKTDSDYDYTSSLDRPGWAWEFLRRSKKYRAAWLEFTKMIAPWEVEFGPFADWAAKGKLLDSEPLIWGFNPQRRPDETIEKWQERVFYMVAAEPIRELLPEWEGRVWQLERMQDPGMCQ